MLVRICIHYYICTPYWQFSRYCLFSTYLSAAHDVGKCERIVKLCTTRMQAFSSIQATTYRKLSMSLMPQALSTLCAKSLLQVSGCVFGPGTFIDQNALPAAAVKRYHCDYRWYLQYDTYRVDIIISIFCVLNGKGVFCDHRSTSFYKILLAVSLKFPYPCPWRRLCIRYSSQICCSITRATAIGFGRSASVVSAFGGSTSLSFDCTVHYCEYLQGWYQYRHHFCMIL